MDQTIVTEPTTVTQLPDSLLYSDGVARPASGGKMFEVISPWTAK